MACIHLQQLYQLCQKHDLHFSSSDLVRIICKECDSEETCPTLLTEISISRNESDQSEPPHKVESP